MTTTELAVREAMRRNQFRHVLYLPSREWNSRWVRLAWRGMATREVCMVGEVLLSAGCQQRERGTWASFIRLQHHCIRLRKTEGNSGSQSHRTTVTDPAAIRAARGGLQVGTLRPR